MIRRQLQDVIEARMFAGKAIIVIGARQVGKSTLFNMVLEGRKESALQLNCDEPEVQEMLSAMNTQELKLLIYFWFLSRYLQSSRGCQGLII